jgi:hypothetical protein
MTVTALLLALVLGGCTRGKEQVSEYLHELKASNEKVNLLMEQMMETSSEVKKQIDSGNFDFDPVKASVLDYADQISGEIERLNALSMPDDVKALHKAEIAKFEAQTEILRQTPLMLDLVARKLALQKALKDDFSRHEELLPDINALDEKIGALEDETEKLSQLGIQHEKTVAEELEKLQKKFGIDVKLEDSYDTPTDPPRTP